MTYLEEKMRRLLDEARLIPEASSGMKLDGKTTSGKSGSKAPKIAGESTFDQFAREFARARTPDQQERAVSRAEKELKTLRGHNRPQPLPERVRVLMFQGVEAKVVAITLHCSERSVKRWRVQQGFEGNYGRKLAAQFPLRPP